MIIYICRNSSK